jgi:predicted RND superfamily exporter protein
MARAEAPGIRVRMIGEPVLAGWVAFHFRETLALLAATLAALAMLLLLSTRSWRGMVFPGLAGLTSAAWALGIAAALGLAFDPLMVVIAFLITARAVSHSLQLVNRFDDEARGGAASAAEAAKNAMLGLFKPGLLGVVADAGCMLVILLMPIPLMKKIALIGAVWMLTIALSAVLMTPLLLSRAKLPLRYIPPPLCLSPPPPAP